MNKGEIGPLLSGFLPLPARPRTTAPAASPIPSANPHLRTECSTIWRSATDRASSAAAGIPLSPIMPSGQLAYLRSTVEAINSPLVCRLPWRCIMTPHARQPSFKEFEADGWHRQAPNYDERAGRMTAEAVQPLLDAVDAGPGMR